MVIKRHLKISMVMKKKKIPEAKTVKKKKRKNLSEVKPQLSSSFDISLNFIINLR